MPQDPRTRPIVEWRLVPESSGFLEHDHGTTNQYYSYSDFTEIPKKKAEEKYKDKQRHLQTKMKTSGQPIDYSQLVLETITKVQLWTCDEIMFNWNSGKQFLRLNQLQCKQIASKLEETQVYLQSQIDCFPWHIKCGEVSQQLYLVVKKAEMLVAECCSEEWLQKALVLIEIKEHIVEIILDLQWWTDMVRISAFLELEKGMYTAQLRRADETYGELLTFCQTEDFLSKEVEHDNQTLMKQLDQVLKARTQCPCLDIFNKKPKEDLELTNYLRHRLRKMCQSNIDAPWKPYVVYTTQNYLGDGSFSTVWEAPWLGQDFALKRSKLLFQRPLETTNITLANEANIHARSCHPHIVQLMCYWEEGTKGDNMPFSKCLLMEKMTGDLHRLMTQRRNVPPFSMLEVVDIMLQIAKAMRFLHNKEVAHRDLKCGNILYKDGPWQLGSNLVVKLGDFGTAKENVRNFTENQNQTWMVGTLGYRAPELSGKNMLTLQRFPPMADVFSFGMTFFEVLTGEPPFSDLDDLQKRINEGERPKLPQTCPPVLKFLIQNCWDEKPQARPTFVQICRMLLHAKNLMLEMRPYEDLEFFFSYRSLEGDLKQLAKSVVSQRVI